MAYSIRVERIGEAATPSGKIPFYKTHSEIEAVTIATYEVDAYRSGPQRLATVFDAAGLLILVYTGLTRMPADGAGAGGDGA